MLCEIAAVRQQLLFRPQDETPRLQIFQRLNNKYIVHNTEFKIAIHELADAQATRVNKRDNACDKAHVSDDIRTSKIILSPS